MDRSSHAVLRMDAVTKVYGTGTAAVTALAGATVTVPRGTFTAVMGPSGSGKSTFLHCAAGLDRPTSGSVRLGEDATDLSSLSETALTLVRRRRIGFVFQDFNLLPSLTVRQNVALPLRLAHRRVGRGRVDRALRAVGLAGRSANLPSQLSGGQQQRVAIARALITDPEVVFADEPTGALDTASAREVLSLMRHAVDDLGLTTVMVTHDPVAASYADAVIYLADGRIVEIMPAQPADRISERVTRLGAWG